MPNKTSFAEVDNRWKMAIRFAGHLSAHQIPARQIPCISDEFWRCTAAVLREKKPSPLTIEAIGYVLQQFEAAASQRDREWAERTVDYRNIDTGAKVNEHATAEWNRIGRKLYKGES